MNEMEFKVGEYTCRVCLPEVLPGTVSHAVVEWDPKKPDHLTDSERKQYEAGMVLALSGMACKPVTAS